MSAAPSREALLDLATGIIAGYLSHNAVAVELLPDLIQSVYAALAGLGTELAPDPRELRPAVPVRKSVFPDHIVCLEDGQKLQTLKRHLRMSHGLTPETYRRRWGLPHEYPMVAPDFARRRSTIAKGLGFGRTSMASNEQPVPAKSTVDSVAKGCTRSSGEVG